MVGKLVYATIASGSSVIVDVESNREAIVVGNPLLCNSGTSVATLELIISSGGTEKTIFKLVAPANSTVNYHGAFNLNLADKTLKLKLTGSVGVYGCVLIA